MFPRRFSLSCDGRHACCGIQQRGPFFSEVLAFNVKMEETSARQRELLFLLPRRCYRDGKFVPYPCSKRQYWPDQCYSWGRKALNPSKRRLLCPDVGISARPEFQVRGWVEFATARALPVSTEELSLLSPEPDAEVTVFTRGGWVFTGFGFNEAGELRFGRKSPLSTQTHECVLCPLAQGP